jgi:hypothetical protein
LQRPSSTSRSNVVAALLVTATFAAMLAAQSPPGSQGPSGSWRPDPSRTYPAPVNLKVLPKDLTGRRVHDIMEQWASSLGARCDACHVEDTESTAHDGKPHLDFADDSKPMKAVARLMYTMTEEINSDYLAKVKGSTASVTCGTCHRGAVNPEPFTFRPAVGPPPQSIPSAEERPQPK